MGAALQAGATLAGNEAWETALSGLVARSVHLDEETRCRPDASEQALYGDMAGTFAEHCSRG